MKSEANFFKLVDGSDKDIAPSDLRSKKVKIVCTIGPSSSRPQTIRQMIRSGMDVARLNFSHGTRAEHLKLLKALRAMAQQEKKHLGILQDIQGPKIRVGRFKGGGTKLPKGKEFIITTEKIVGDEQVVSCNLPNLHLGIKAGHRIMLDDGLIFLVVEKVRGRRIHTRVIFGGFLRDNKGMNLPDTSLRLSCLTKKDKEDLEFGLHHGVDFIGLSFVSSASDIEKVKRIVDKHKNSPLLVAKIETFQATKNIDAILAIADGVMVARGDLGVECALEIVPGIQKRIIRSANRAGKFVITATQMLESMTHSPRPTRAEASDVANAVLDGSDAVMLSAETATGQFPIESVKTMARIVVVSESYSSSYSDIQSHRLKEVGQDIAHAITAAAVQSTNTLHAEAIVAFTHRGTTAQQVSRLRPSPPIYGLSPFESTCRRLSIVWGVIPAQTKPMKHPDEMPELARGVLQTMKRWKKNSRVVMVSGTPVLKPGTTNLLKVHEIK